MKKNDLTRYERDLLDKLNFLNGTKYKYYHFAEWSTKKGMSEKNLLPGEIIYEVSGLFVTIDPNGKSK